MNKKQPARLVLTLPLSSLTLTYERGNTFLTIRHDEDIARAFLPTTGSTLTVEEYFTIHDEDIADIASFLYSAWCSKGYQQEVTGL